ncbi:hypothetical protein D9V34_09430 [Mycetocola lacteus]|uniref:Uncharacterized protein n=1 Tax=Mycetocola lacteus TaxID=76637 RepID=A0A3L7APY9_9MICO|nr:hypothetical protein [Mycetocola lacteus]RLP82035.1 hypothetical protein D9V34_09430 [Mycetocola lacteus]
MSIPTDDAEPFDEAQPPTRRARRAREEEKEDAAAEEIVDETVVVVRTGLTRAAHTSEDTSVPEDATVVVERQVKRHTGVTEVPEDATVVVERHVERHTGVDEVPEDATVVVDRGASPTRVSSNDQDDATVVVNRPAPAEQPAPSEQLTPSEQPAPPEQLTPSENPTTAERLTPPEKLTPRDTSAPVAEVAGAEVAGAALLPEGNPFRPDATVTASAPERRIIQRQYGAEPPAGVPMEAAERIGLLPTAERDRRFRLGAVAGFAASIVVAVVGLSVLAFLAFS